MAACHTGEMRDDHEDVLRDVSKLVSDIGGTRCAYPKGSFPLRGVD